MFKKYGLDDIYVEGNESDSDQSEKSKSDIHKKLNLFGSIFFRKVEVNLYNTRITNATHLIKINIFLVLL